MLGTPELRHDITAVDKSSAAWRSFERNATRVEHQIKGMTSELSKFGALARSGLAGLGVGIASAGLADIAGDVRRAVAEVAALGDAAERAGVASDFLQTLRYQLEQNGASARDADEAIRRFNRRLGEFVNSGGGPAAKAFKELGIATTDAAGKMRSTEAIYRDVVALLGQIDDQARVAAYAAQFFGDDAGPRLAQSLAGGIQSLRETEKEMKRLGLVMSKDMVDAAGDLDKAMSRLSARWQATWHRMAVTAATNVDSILTRFDRLFKVTNQGELDALQLQVAELVNARTKLEDRIADATKPLNIPGMSNPLSGFLNREGIEEDRAAVERLNRQIAETKERIDVLQGFDRNFVFPDLPDLPTLPDDSPGTSGEKPGRSTGRRSMFEDRTWNDFNRNVKSATDEMTRLNREADNLKSAGEAFGSTLANALGKAIDGTFSLRDALSSVLRQLSSSALNSVFSKLGGQVFGSLFGGKSLVGGGGGGGSRFAGFFADGGRIPAGMFGIAGEAGPEIVTGPANVAPVGGGVSVNIINASGEKVETRETRTAQGGRNLEVMIGKVVAGQIATPGSPVARSLQTVHGLSPNVTRRS